MDKVGEKAKIASISLVDLRIEKKNAVLKQFVKYLKANKKSILNANNKDMSNAKSKKIKENMLDRLKLDNKKIEQIIKSIEKIIKFKNPVGKTLYLPSSPH